MTDPKIVRQAQITAAQCGRAVAQSLREQVQIDAIVTVLIHTEAGEHFASWTNAGRSRIPGLLTASRAEAIREYDETSWGTTVEEPGQSRRGE